MQNNYICKSGVYIYTQKNFYPKHLTKKFFVVSLQANTYL